MNAFQKCGNTSDAVPLYLPQQLFLKPIARINITVQLTAKMLGKTIRHHEVMEKLRNLILPDEFSSLKVTKTTLEFIKFEAELDLKNMISKVLSKLDNRTIKLADFTELMRVRAGEAKLDFPTRHEWDAYFRDAKDMNEMKPGERPDTVHFGNLPTKWFVPSTVQSDEDLLPSEKIFYYTFKKFGSIRNTDIPICDPYRSKMKQHITGVQISSFDDTDFFEGYIQFKDYIGFSKCMDALRGMKLMQKDKNETITVNIIVNFDKSKHLSEGNIKRRDIVRDRLLIKQKTKEDKLKQAEEAKKEAEMAVRQKELDKQNAKEKRRREREEKRKAKIMAQLKTKENDNISEKIAKEEKKILKVQRRLEAIRLVEELFKQIQDKHKNSSGLYDDELEKTKSLTEFKELKNKRKLKDTIEQRVILKSVIADQAEDSSSSSSLEDIPVKSRNNSRIDDQNDYNYDNSHPSRHLLDYNNAPPPQYYHNRGGFPSQRSRGYSRPPRNFHGRPYNHRGRGRGMVDPFIQKEYYKYAQTVLAYQLQQNSLNYPRSRSPRRSRSYSRSRSHSRRRSRSRSYSRRARSRSRRSRSSTRSRRSRSHSRRSRDSRRSRSIESRRSRQRSWSRRSPSVHTPPKRKTSTNKSPRKEDSVRRSKSRNSD